MNRTEIRDAIHDNEFYGNGMQHMSNVGVSVRNLRVNKTEAVADIIIYLDDVTERTNNCHISLRELESMNRQRG
jgi:hypothetical protein